MLHGAKIALLGNSMASSFRHAIINGQPTYTPLDLFNYRSSAHAPIRTCRSPRLLEKYRNRPISLADACNVRMTELHERHAVLTFVQISPSIATWPHLARVELPTAELAIRQLIRGAGLQHARFRTWEFGGSRRESLTLGDLSKEVFF